LQEGINKQDVLFLENFHARWLDGRISKLENDKNIGRGQQQQQMGKNKEEKKQGGRNVQPQEQEDQAPQN
jgi:hypothetical protein